MTYALTWLPEVLESAGLKVAETPGWRTRGRAEMGAVKGVICHHTAATQSGNMPSLRMLIEGRPDLTGPLCHLGLGRDGTFYVVAAGRANHAGAGAWEGLSTGNSNFLGIEAENSGAADDPWPVVQIDAYQRGVAAVLRHVGATSNMCCGHKEYAPGRKVDPSFDMATFRNALSAFMQGRTGAPPIPAVDDRLRQTLRRGDQGDAVKDLQRRVGVDPTGLFGAGTEAALRLAQGECNLVADGICGPRTWAVLSGEKARPADPPPSIPALPAPPIAATRAVARPAATSPPGGPARSVGDDGVKLIQKYEQCETRQGDGTFKAYPDPGSKDGHPWTIGWGSTGKDVEEGVVWSEQACDARFRQDLSRYAQEVSRAIGQAETSPHQFDALVAFHYNTGAIFKATLTKRHVAGDYAGAREAFAWYNKNNGKVMRGLTLRRKAEADLYAGG